MQAIDVARLTFGSLVAHRLRTVLTMLGILIGVASVILLTSIGEGTRSYIMASFEQFGTNVLAVSPGKTQTSGSPGAMAATVRKLTIEDAEAIDRLPFTEGVVPLAMGMARVEARDRGRSVYIYGVTSDVPAVWNFKVQQGRFLPEADPRRSAPLAVLGPKLKREIFGEVNALGKHVRIGEQRFQVIGIMAPKGQMLGIDLDDCAYIPTANAQQIFDRNALMEIDVLFSSNASEERVIASIKEVLIDRHEGEEDFSVISQSGMLDVLDNILGVISAAVGGIAAISLLVGAIGILSMMWISVNERTQEIGLTKALGATGSQVLWLFLVEAVILSLFGGLAGIGVGLGLARLLQLIWPGLPLVIPWQFVGAAVVVSFVVGLLSGVLPARRAAALDPIMALRDD
jgi:putative ABC transport system permease protein